jgi:hypothetical protein
MKGWASNRAQYARKPSSISYSIAYIGVRAFSQRTVSRLPYSATLLPSISREPDALSPRGFVGIPNLLHFGQCVPPRRPFARFVKESVGLWRLSIIASVINPFPLFLARPLVSLSKLPAGTD